MKFRTLNCKKNWKHSNDIRWEIYSGSGSSSQLKYRGNKWIGHEIVLQYIKRIAFNLDGTLGFFFFIHSKIWSNGVLHFCCSREEVEMSEGGVTGNKEGKNTSSAVRRKLIKKGGTCVRIRCQWLLWFVVLIFCCTSSDGKRLAFFSPQFGAFEKTKNYV